MQLTYDQLLAMPSAIPSSPDSAAEDSRLLLISNRLPITIRRTEDGGFDVSMSSGGLVSGLSGLSKYTKFQWYGWPGKVLSLPFSFWTMPFSPRLGLEIAAACTSPARALQGAAACTFPA